MKYENKTIPTTKLLSQLGLEGEITGHNIYTKCPFHQDSSPSFAFNVENGLWICFSGKCGKTGNLEQLVVELLGMTRLQAINWLVEMSEPGAASLEQILNKTELVYERPKEMLPDGLISDVDIPFLRDRGFDANDIREWSIKCEPSTGAAIIPTHEGFIRRYPPGAGNGLRYQYSAGFSRRVVLFGYERLLRRSGRLDTILLTEGSLDTIWADKFGYNSLSILGSTISDEQVRLVTLLNAKEIALAFDNDEAGNKATLIAVKKLSQYTPNLSYVKIPEGAKDLQDLNEEQLHNTIRNRVSILQANLAGLGPWNEKAKL